MPGFQLFKIQAASIDKNHQIMVYCGREINSPGVVQRLVSMGFINVYELKGGLNAWKRHKLPLVDAQNQSYVYDN